MFPTDVRYNFSGLAGLIPGLERSLTDLPRATAPRKLDGKQEALLVALACSAVPGGRATWTMQMLADKLVELNVVETISDETIRRTLKKRSETLAKTPVVHSNRQRRIRLADGRCLGPLR